MSFPPSFRSYRQPKSRMELNNPRGMLWAFAGCSVAGLVAYITVKRNTYAKKRQVELKGARSSWKDETIDEQIAPQSPAAVIHQPKDESSKG